jgi:hypothetical protein
MNCEELPAKIASEISFEMPASQWTDVQALFH